MSLMVLSVPLARKGKTPDVQLAKRINFTLAVVVSTCENTSCYLNMFDCNGHVPLL